MTPEEWQEAPGCYCGKRGCIETWVSGPGLARTLPVMAAAMQTADVIAQSDAPAAKAAMARHWIVSPRARDGGQHD